MLRCNIPLAALLLLALSACGSGASRACRVDADCASLSCSPDGTCQSSAQDAGSDAGAPDGGGDGGNGSDAGNPSDAGPAGCTPNHDGIISSAEVPLAAGLHATYRVATSTAVDSAGSGSGDPYAWDLSGALANDTDTSVTLLPVAGSWFAADFAGATYATPLAAGSTLLGVFEVTASALLLRGVVSPTQSAGYTELTYATPVQVLAFPFQEGSTWSTTSVVSGVASGLAAYYSETYVSLVDRRGTLDTPYGTFPVLRVRTDLTQTVGLLVTTTRTFSFESECFGTVGLIRAASDDTSAEPTQAAEVRRLAP